LAEAEFYKRGQPVEVFFIDLPLQREVEEQKEMVMNPLNKVFIFHFD
jgi:hypothetical protein